MFTQPIVRPSKKGPEVIPHFWNPNNVSIKLAPEWFRDELKRLDPDLEMTWNPVEERWQLFVKSPRMQHPLCHGWRLLFIHHAADGSYLPLNELVFARIASIDGRRQGDAVKYFDRVVAEMNRDKEMREKKWRQDTIDAAMPSWEHSQIKNIGKGSKFATYMA
jgi:hypothetical protein